MMCEERFRHYSFGIKEIDDDHWRAFQLLNKVLEQLKNEKYEEADKSLELLSEFVVTHNALELRMMEESNYPYTKWHLENNVKIIRMATQLKKHIGDEHVTRHQINDFENAIVNHIDHHDRQFANYLLK